METSAPAVNAMKIFHLMRCRLVTNTFYTTRLDTPFGMSSPSLRVLTDA